MQLNQGWQERNYQKVLFKGFNARILRVGIAQAVTFIVYENYVSYMRNIIKNNAMHTLFHDFLITFQ